jgi:hypothetical protein
MERFVNTYSDGMDQDSSLNKFDPKHYFEAWNFSPLTDQGLANGAMNSIRSTLYRLNPSLADSSYYIIGHCVIRNYLVIFTTTCTAADPGGADPEGTDGITTLDLTDPTLSPVVFPFTMSGLNFSTQHPIFDQTVGRYERSDFIKVWWTDNFNVLRGMNIMDPPDDISDIDISGDVTMSQPTISAIGNGSINVGMVQYAYQLYNLGGSETIFSPVSPLYNLTTESYYQANTSSFKGSDSRDDQDASINSGKSITISISGLDTDYDRIRVVAIHYDRIDATPEINIVTENLFSSSITVLDPGTYVLGSISLEEFRTLGGEVFTCKTIEEKDNMLFAGNISYQQFDFDWDARAYRFNSIGNGVIYDKSWNPTVLQISGTWPDITITNQATSQAIPETHDAICRYNAYYNGTDWVIPEIAPYSNTDDNSYKYQVDGTTLGGEGENIKYEFVTRIQALSSRESFQPHRAVISNGGDLGSYMNYANPYNAANYVGHKKDEIYRYALIAFDNKGRGSYAKWIADIRMPVSTGYDNYTTAFNYFGITSTRVLGVKFTVDTSSFPSYITGFKIVRVKREENDKTILFSGMLSATKHNRISGTPVHGPQLIPRYKLNPSPNNECPWSPYQQICEIISPEINVYKNQYHQAGDYIKVSGVLDDRVFRSNQNYDTEYGVSGQTHNINWTQTDQGLNYAGMYVRYDRNYGINADVANSLDYMVNVENAVIQGPVHYIDALANILNDFDDYVHFACATDQGNNNKAESGTRYLIDLGSQTLLPYHLESDDWSMYVVDYKRHNVASIYGGMGYIERQSNEYISCGNFVSRNNFAEVLNPSNVDGTESDVYGGDTYIAMFGHRYSMIDLNDYDEDGSPDIWPDIFVSHVTFPVETSINIEYLHGPRAREYTLSGVEGPEGTIGDPSQLRHMKEKSGVYPLYLSLQSYTQEEDMYLYNSTYSQQNTTQIFFPKPADFERVLEYDNLILHSNVKSNNESVDSYFKFLPDNAIEVDTGYGPINKLVRFKNYMIFFQDHGVGTISVNERQLVPVENNAALELGHGGVLDRYDMIATGVGAQTPESVVQTENAFYWVDMYKKAMYRYSGKSEDITTVKGMMSFMQALPDIAGNRVCVDTSFVLLSEFSKFKQVYMSVYTASDQYLLVYNELTDSFTHMLEMDVPYMISANNRSLTYQNYRECYTMYEGSDFGNLHGSYVDGSISYIINPNSNIVNTFHNFEISSEVYDNAGDNMTDRTMDTVRIRNDYQDTGVVTLTPGTNARRLLRTWTMHLPRDNSARIRDSYIRADFTFDHSAQERIVMHDLITTYDVPAEMLIK